MERTRLNFDDFSAELLEIGNERISISIVKPEKWNPCVSVTWWDSIEDCGFRRSACTIYKDEVQEKFKAVID